MEMFWFFQLRFRRTYDSAYDSDFWFLLGHKLPYDSDSDSDSVVSENQPLVLTELPGREQLFFMKHLECRSNFEKVRLETL